MKISALGHHNWGMTHDARHALEARMEALDPILHRDAAVGPGMAAALAYNGKPTVVPEITGDTACIEIFGDILARAPWWAKAYLGAVDPFDVVEVIDELTGRAGVARLVIEIDSCGGTVTGAEEVAASIKRFQAAGKTVEVRAAGVLASAAYWMVCGADKITATPTTHVGSLGVYNLLCDQSQMLGQAGVRLEAIVSAEGKGLGADGHITPAQREQTQRRVDALVAVFRDTVAAGRGLSADAVAAVFTGDTWLGAEALRLGLVDAVASQPDEADADSGNTPAPVPAVPLITQPVDSTESATASTPPAAAGTQESETMDKKLQAALAALVKDHPNHAAAITEKALADGATAEGLQAFAAGVINQAKDARITALEAQVGELNARVTAAEQAKAKAETDKAAAEQKLAKIEGHAQGTHVASGDETLGKDVRKITDATKLTQADMADIQAGKAALVVGA